MNPLKHFIPVLLLLPLVTNGNEAPKKVVMCYYLEDMENETDMLTPEDIDPAICTYIIYEGVIIDSENLQLRARNPKIDLYDNGGKGYYNRTIQLKEQNPNLKILLEVCCLRHYFWDKKLRGSHSDPINSTTIPTFAETVVNYLQMYGFDGMNILWHDNDNMAPLMARLRTEFDKHGLILSTYLSQIRDRKQDEYHIPSEIAGLVDLMIFGSFWDTKWSTTKIFSSTTKMKKYVSAYLEQGFPPEKLVVSIPTLTATLNLCDDNETGIGAPICLNGPDGEEEPNMEILGYHEMTERLKNTSEEWVVERDEESGMPYAHSKSLLWISYEDPVSVRAKARYVLEKNLAGVAFMMIDSDDFKGNNEEGIKFPLTRAAYDVLNGY